MSIGSRIHDSVQQWSKEWGDMLRGWLTSVLSFGLELFFDVIGKAFAPKLTPLIEKLEATGEVPPELQPILDEIKNPKGEVAAFLAQSAGGALVGGALGSIVDALFMRFAYSVNRTLHPKLPNEMQLIAMWLRGIITEDKLTDYLRSLGADDLTVTTLKELSKVRLNPEMVSRLWLRNKSGYEHLWKELSDSGVTPDRITYFKELSHVIPQIQDLILMAVREAFTPEIAEKFGQYQDFPEAMAEWAEKQGLSREWAERYWAAHWDLPSVGQGFDMMHRGVITEQELALLLRAKDVMPFWRDNLTAISWDLPNRIELRMMARYGLVDKKFLVDMLGKVGLSEEYRDISADMMLALGIRSDIATRYSKGWLDAAGVKSELVKSGLSEQIRDRMYTWIVDNTAPERVTKERDLTVTDILKGVKKNIISRADGVSLIQQMGYDKAEAEFKLAINVPVEEEVKEVKQRELTKADILKAYKLKELDQADTLTRLMEIRYSQDDATLLIKLADATKETIPDTKTRELTKVDILKGVKVGVLAPEEGYLMLQDIGYSPEDSAFILTVQAEAIAGSPNTYNEYLKMTQDYRASQRMTNKPIPQELIQAERDVKAAQAAYNLYKSTGVKAARLAELKRAVDDAQLAYHQLLSKQPK